MADNTPGTPQVPWVRIQRLISVTIMVLTTGFVIYIAAQFGRVAHVVGGDNGREGVFNNCVETYGFTLSKSQFYERESSYGAPRRPQYAPREIATVVHGMARNTCGQRLKSVGVRLVVTDDSGKKGDAWANVGDLEPYQTKPFERAWIGDIATYKVVAVR